MNRNTRGVPKLILACILLTGFVFNARAQDDSGVSLTVTGAGTLTLTGDNTYTGSTIVSGGTIMVTGGDTLTGEGTITGTGDGTLAGGGTIIATGGGTLTGTSNGIITGSTGASGTLTFTGGDTLGSLGGSVVVSSGGAFTVAGTEDLSSDLTLDPGSTLDLSVNTSTALANTLSIAGNVTLDDPSLIITDLAPTPQAVADGTTFTLIHYDGTETGEVAINGALIPNGGVFTLGDNAYALDYAEGDPNVTISAVPEPSTWIMVMGGVAFLACLRRVKRANS